MMRNKKNIAAKFFTFLICLSLLTGCSGNNDKSTDTGKDTQVTATAEPDNKVTGTESGNENKDPDDKTDTNDSKAGTGSSEKDTDDKNQTGNNESGKNSDDGNDGKDDSGKGNTDNNAVSTDFIVPASASFKTINIEYKNKDLETSYVPGDCTSIVFSENDVKAVGKETEISHENGRQTVKIVKKGDYLISGICSNGQIIVEANKEKDVRLILNGLVLTCTDSAPIYEKQCDKLVITLADGTENVLSDTSEYVYDNAEKKQPDAVIFAKDDLVINGNGTLKVNSAYSEGIHSTDSVKLISGNITVNSGDNGVRGKEGVMIKGANLDITSKGDGIRTTYADNTSLGYIIIEGGDIKVYSAKDAIQATGHIQISGGNVNLTTDNGTAHAGSDEESKSAKGIKSDNDLCIKGGALSINSTDDGININGNFIVEAGSLSVSSYDDAVKADGDAVINGGTVTISNSNKGIKARSVSLNGGSVSVVSDADGIKASGSKEDDDSDSKVIFGEEDPFAVSEGVYVAVTGGTADVKSGGECIDSDGNLYITGGSVMVESTGSTDSDAVAYKGTAYISGGTVEAKGIGDISAKILGRNE